MIVIWRDHEKGTAAWDTKAVSLVLLSGNSITACVDRGAILTAARFSSDAIAQEVFHELATLIHDEDSEERGPFIVDDFVNNTFD